MTDEEVKVAPSAASNDDDQEPDAQPGTSESLAADPPEVLQPAGRERYTDVHERDTVSDLATPASATAKHEGEPGHPVFPDTGEEMPPELAGDQPTAEDLREE